MTTLEIAQIDIKDGTNAAFEEAVTKAAPLFRRSKGCLSMELHRSHELPNRYRLFVQWATLENHTVDFRASEEFAQWRALVSPYFEAPPAVEHVTLAVKGF